MNRRNVAKQMSICAMAVKTEYIDCKVYVLGYKKCRIWHAKNGNSWVELPEFIFVIIGDDVAEVVTTNACNALEGRELSRVNDEDEDFWWTRFSQGFCVKV